MNNKKVTKKMISEGIITLKKCFKAKNNYKRFCRILDKYNQSTFENNELLFKSLNYKSKAELTSMIFDLYGAYEEIEVV